MRRSRLQLAALIAASASGFVAWGQDKPTIALEQARLARREALVRILDASGEDYVIGPGFEEIVALRLSQVRWSKAVERLLAQDEALVRGRIVIVGGHALRRWRFVPVPSSNPEELARIVRSLLGAGGRSLCDVPSHLLLLYASADEIDRVERVVANFERPLPCLCLQGSGDALIDRADRPAGAADAEKITMVSARIGTGEALIALARKAGVDLPPTRADNEISLRLRNVPARVALDAVLDASGGADSFGAGGESTSVKLIPVVHRPAASLVSLARELSTEHGSVDVESAHNTLVVKDDARGLARIESLVRRLDLVPDPTANPCGCPAAAKPPR